MNLRPLKPLDHPLASCILCVVSFSTSLIHQKLKSQSTCFDPINISVPNIMDLIGAFLVTKVLSTDQKQSHVCIAKLLKSRAFDLGEIKGPLKPSEKLNDNLNYLGNCVYVWNIWFTPYRPVNSEEMPQLCLSLYQKFRNSQSCLSQASFLEPLWNFLEWFCLQCVSFAQSFKWC